MERFWLFIVIGDVIMIDKYFTADQHFGHAKIIKYQRPQFNNVDEMDQVMIDRWNETVPARADVYCLGDIFLCQTERAITILDQLNGRIHLVRGNHDYKMARVVKDRFVWIKDRYELKIRQDNQSIILDHYAGRTWNKAIHGSWQLYGHSHGNLPDDSNLLAFDVGVDCHDFYPVSYSQVREMMQHKKQERDAV